ncbi:MAG: 4-alpha-glucanotransferase, partial [Steroidobacteraceae bacterium]
MNDDAFERLAQVHGIGVAYNDFRNEPREISRDSKLAVLAAMEIDASSAGNIDAALSKHDTVHWMRMLPPAVVVTSGMRAVLAVSVPLDLKATSAAWSIMLESGELRSGSTRLNKLQVSERGSTEGRSFERVELVLPQDLPLGYHQATVTLDTGLSGDTRLIVAPDSCYEPPVIQKGERVWGIAVQLYSLRSDNNWGMGDFHDLRELIELSAPLGCSIIGLNPLHALMPANPAHISPYSPSSREFLNVLYISVPDVPEFTACEAAVARVKSAEFQKTLAELRAPGHVNYVGVAAAKFSVLREVYEQFRSTHLAQGTARAQAFRKYVESRGEPLRLHAIF